MNYQDFLSTLSILFEAVPDLSDRPIGSIRIVFGTNTDNGQTLAGAGRPVAEEARAYFLGAQGFSVADLADLRAVLAMTAIESGVISLRIYDPALAAEELGRTPPLLHAKLFVGKDHILSGSANFSQGGLRRNLEFIDDAAPWPDLASARRDAAERFWALGRDWTEEALDILRGLVRLVSPEEAIARTVIEAQGFAPWRVTGISSTGRLPQPFQADLVYEAAGTIYEHGFAFVEAPTGAGKTDIGKHLATVLPVTHAQTVTAWGAAAEDRRQGALALIPASVKRNWSDQARAFEKITHSFLSRRSEAAELEDIHLKVRNAAAMIVDESHRLSSRYLAPSTRAMVFERSPAIWTACLSATLMGNQGLDGLLAFHERRASIHVPPGISNQINAHMQKVREHSALQAEIATIKRQLDEQHVQADFFLSAGDLQSRVETLENTLDARGLRLAHLQAGLAEALSPFVVRRQRACIGESSERKSDAFVYPKMQSHRRDAELTPEQQRIISRIKQLAEAITTGTTLVSADPQRAARTEVKFHDKSRIHIRNFLALLRASITFTRQEWLRERDSEADQRGRASVGESLRRAERQNPRRLQIPSGELPNEIDDEIRDPTLCDRIGRLLADPALDTIDKARASAMRAILRKHPHAIFLAERIGVLEVYARLLAETAEAEVLIVAPGAKIETSTTLKLLRSGAEAQEYFGLNGQHAEPLRARAMFLTFQMAEGINLQHASALGIVGVTSDVKSLIQGLGRIDRIDSPHSKIHYYTFDLPGLVLSSDRKARARVANIAMLSGVGAEDLPSELVEYAAGDLTDLVLDQIRKPRPLRVNNAFDRIEDLRRSLPHEVLGRVRAASPEGLWGAELCFLAAEAPVTVLVLGGRTGSPAEPAVLPPRLVAIRSLGENMEVVGDQPEVARLLSDAWAETRRRGLAHRTPTLVETQSLLERLADTLPQLTHWDLRPVRTVSLLASLARFLVGGDAEDQGQTLFGDLPLPALENLAEAWAVALDPAWIEAKIAVSKASATGRDIPDYLGIEAIEMAFYRQHKEIVEAVRERMLTLLKQYRAMTAGQPIDIQSRVAVVFESQ